jgi:hypothetical protein
MVLAINLLLDVIFFVVIATCNTFVMHALPPPAALSLAQYVSSGVATHLGDAHTHFRFCYAGFGLVMDTLVSIITWV